MESNKLFFDENFTRYQLVKSSPGTSNYNWLFFPGGPGIDSDYLLHLINKIEIEGNCWLVDFLLNGSNIPNEAGFDPNKICQNWGNYFLTAINKFDNPILVGHSFFGYFPLFFPELEKILKGFVILSTAPIPPTSPKLDTNEFEKRAKENNLPYLNEALTTFLKNPTMNTARERYLSLAPYAFPKEKLAQGIKLIKTLVVNVDAAYWWVTEGCKVYSTINWIPKKIPILILGGSHDFITPLDLFKQDIRFRRNNIEIICIQNAGHFPWMDQPALIKKAFSCFLEKLNL